MFLLFGPRARRRGERRRPESGAQQRSGSSWGQAPGRRAAARARRWRQAARRVRGRRGRAGRCVLVGQFRAPRYVAARQPRRDGRPRPQSPRPHPPPARRQWPRPAGAGSLRPRPCPARSCSPSRRRYQQPASLPGRCHRRLQSTGRTRAPRLIQCCATVGAAVSTGASLGRGPRSHPLRPAAPAAAFALQVAAAPR